MSSRAGLWVTVAAAQDGLLRRDQANAHGVSDDAIRHRLRSGTWQRVLPGVYATFSGPLPQQVRELAALLLAGDRSMLHEATACRRYGLRYLPPDDGRVHVLVGHPVQKTGPGFVVLHRTHLMPTPLLRAGLRCSPPARAVVDLCRRPLRMQDVRAIMCEVVQRGRTTTEAMTAVLEAGHSAGSAQPRRVLGDLQAGCRSAPECELRDLVATSAILPEPQWNVRVEDRTGRLLGYPDAWWRDARLAAEVNSREHHFYGEDWDRTMRRQAGFAAEGVLVVPVTPHRLRHSGCDVLAELELAYLSRMPPMIQAARPVPGHRQTHLDHR